MKKIHHYANSQLFKSQYSSLLTKGSTPEGRDGLEIGQQLCENFINERNQDISNPSAALVPFVKRGQLLTLVGREIRNFHAFAL